MKKTRPTKTVNKKMVINILPEHDSVMTTLVWKYLKLVYPIFRINTDGKFKRTIIIDGKGYTVSKNKEKFIPSLIDDISKTFAINKIETKKIILDYFKIKNF